MDETQIDRAQLSDLDDILEVENSSFGADRFSRRQFTYLIAHAKGVFLVVRQEGKVVAYLSVLAKENASVFRMYSLAVHPKARGQKLAQRLIDAILDYARQHHYKSLGLEVNVNNAGAISLYKMYGFQTAFIKKEYYHDGSDAYVMRLPL